jgi:acetyl-CoA C-acetyltransferase
MREVFIAGIGQSPVRRGDPTSLRTLGASVVRAAIADAALGEPTALVVGNMLGGTLCHQRQLGIAIAERAGLVGIEATRVEAACASGAAALRQGVLAIASGEHDIVVVCGVERMTHADKDTVTHGLATASDWENEGAHGETFLSLNAALTARYLETHGLSASALAPFSMTAHANAARNPNALLRKSVTLEAYEDARVIAPPLRLFDVSPICDGAAAVILVSGDALRAARPNGARVRVVGSAVATDTLALADRRDPLVLDAVARSTARVYAQAGITSRHVDLFELHDAYSVMAALSLEAAGFAERGRAVELAREGRIGLGGDVPIATMGGLKARGHPVGATGVYQAVEAYQQLLGLAGDNQLPTPHIAMLQGFGGTGATVVTHLFERVA